MAVETPTIQAPQAVPTPAGATSANAPLTAFQQSNGGVQAFQFLNGSGVSATGQNVPAPVVVTADAAKNDLAKKQADLTAASNAQALQATTVAQNNTVNQQNANVAASQSKPITADDINKAVNGGYDYSSLGLTENTPTPTKQYDPTPAPTGFKYMYDSAGNRVQVPESPADSTNDQLKNIQAQQDSAYQNLNSQLTQLQQGTFPLTPDQLSQVNALQAQFNQLKTQQETTNKNYTGGITNAGIASGRNRYAPEIELGNISNSISVGIQKIADIDAKASSAIASLKQGFADNNFKLINAAYDAANNYFSQKTQIIQDMSTNVRQQTQDALAKHQSDLEDAKFKLQQEQAEQAKQQAAQQFALDQQVTKPFYLLGKDAINTATGQKVSLEEYQKLTGQKVGTPESETDFSQIQTDLQTPNDRKLAQDQAQFQANYNLDLAKFSLDKQKYLLDASKTPSRDTSWQDINGTKVLVDNQTGEVISNPSTQPGLAKATSELQTQALTSAQDLLDKFTGSNGSAAVGKSRLFGLQYIPGTKTKDFEIQFNNLKSLLSLDNIKLLKGQGAVSDSERQLLADASSKLNLGQSEGEFKTALENIVKSLTGKGSLDTYIEKNPDKLDAVSKIEKDNPKLTDDEILQILNP